MVRGSNTRAFFTSSVNSMLMLNGLPLPVAIQKPQLFLTYLARLPSGQLKPLAALQGNAAAFARRQRRKLAGADLDGGLVSHAAPLPFMRLAVSSAALISSSSTLLTTALTPAR